MCHSKFMASFLHISCSKIMNLMHMKVPFSTLTWNLLKCFVTTIFSCICNLICNSQLSKAYFIIEEIDYITGFIVVESHRTLITDYFGVFSPTRQWWYSMLILFILLVEYMQRQFVLWTSSLDQNSIRMTVLLKSTFVVHIILMLLNIDDTFHACHMVYCFHHLSLLNSLRHSTWRLTFF